VLQGAETSSPCQNSSQNNPFTNSLFAVLPATEHAVRPYHDARQLQNTFRTQPRMEISQQQRGWHTSVRNTHTIAYKHCAYARYCTYLHRGTTELERIKLERVQRSRSL
jgi:hypothetical protein